MESIVGSVISIGGWLRNAHCKLCNLNIICNKNDRIHFYKMGYFIIINIYHRPSSIFLGFPPPEAAEVRSTDSCLLVGKPTLCALGPLGAAIVTNLVFKPHAQVCCFGLSYSIVAKASLC